MKRLAACLLFAAVAAGASVLQAQPDCWETKVTFAMGEIKCTTDQGGGCLHCPT